MPLMLLSPVRAQSFKRRCEKFKESGFSLSKFKKKGQMHEFYFSFRSKSVRTKGMEVDREGCALREPNRMPATRPSRGNPVLRGALKGSGASELGDGPDPSAAALSTCSLSRCPWPGSLNTESESAASRPWRPQGSGRGPPRPGRCSKPAAASSFSTEVKLVHAVYYSI